MNELNNIPFEQINLGERGRTVYARIEELAQSILDNGLIQPIVLVPLSDGQGFGVDAGGRRFKALEYLKTVGTWDGLLYHGLTSVPGKAGYVMKGEEFVSPLQRLLTEIAENLDREDMDWRDQTKLLVKAWHTALVEAHVESRDILMRDFGAMLGCGYMDLRAAVVIHDDLITNPDRYKDCLSIRMAHTKLLKVNEIELTKKLAQKTLKGERLSEPVVQVTADPEQEPVIPAVNIALTQSFKCCNSIDYMIDLQGVPTFDHIITDPDYGVSIERLEASMDTASGIAQVNIEESLSTLFQLIGLAAGIVKPGGFLVFWYDLDHHEKLQRCALSHDWRVQRWPLIWHKTDYRSNSSPQHNFCKNFEYAMVCRKPNAVLARAQMSSIYACPSAGVQKELGHPFAKPIPLTKWIYSAVAIKGQSVYDPFMGSGAMSIAAAEWGLKPSGTEINPDNYANGIMNLQKAFTKLIGGKVNFS